MPTPILSSFIAVASLCLAVRWVPVEKSIWFWFTFLAFCAAVVRWCHARTIRLSWADQRRAITAPGTRGVVPADVSVTHSFFAAPRSGAATCALHVTEFRCENAPARAVVLMLPGYGDHFAAFPGRHAIRLSQAGFAVFGLEYEGFGLSDGLFIYVRSSDQLVRDTLAVARQLRQRFPDLPLFIHGESLGGAVALAASLAAKSEPDLITGLVLAAPMCKIEDKLKPPQFVISIFMLLARLLPTWPIAPVPEVLDKCFVQKEYLEQTYRLPILYTMKPRLQTAAVLLKFSLDLEKHLADVTIPFLVLQGDADKICDPSVSRDLHERARSKDKTLKVYPGMWHALMIGDAPAKHDRVFADTIAWIDARL